MSIIDKKNYVSYIFPHPLFKKRNLRYPPEDKVFSLCPCAATDIRREVINWGNLKMIPHEKIVKALFLVKGVVCTSYWIILDRKSGRDAYKVY